MPDLVLIPLPGIGTLSLTPAEYEAALVPIIMPEVSKTESTSRPVSARRADSSPIPREPLERSGGLRYLACPRFASESDSGRQRSID